MLVGRDVPDVHVDIETAPFLNEPMITLEGTREALSEALERLITPGRHAIGRLASDDIVSANVTRTDDPEDLDSDGWPVLNATTSRDDPYLISVRLTEACQEFYRESFASSLDTARVGAHLHFEWYRDVAPDAPLANSCFDVVSWVVAPVA